MRYRAFVSYSHAGDGRLAPELQSALQKFAKPWYLLRALRIFRDKTSLASTPGLWTSIEEALSRSEFFLLLASPDAAASPWISREVQWWLTNRNTATMLIVLTGGDVFWNPETSDFDRKTTTALPARLFGSSARNRFMSTSSGQRTLINSRSGTPGFAPQSSTSRRPFTRDPKTSSTGMMSVSTKDAPYRRGCGVQLSYC